MANRDEMSEVTDAQAAVPGSAAEALKKHEAAKMSRRAVLSKVGLQFGAAALLALSVDDIARKVTATIATRQKDSQVAQAVAQEFKNAGVAFAEDSDSSIGIGCSTIETGTYCGNLHKGHPDVCLTCCKGVYGSTGDCHATGDFLGINSASCNQKCSGIAGGP